MEVQCECGRFRAKLNAFPRHTPGRLVCYCDDCQTYLHYLNRADLLDANGGTEVIPTYPSDVEITSGQDQLKCTRLSPRGVFRFSTSCCNTPIANTAPGRAWFGLSRNVYPKSVEAELGPVRARIMGKFAKGTPPAGTPEKFNLKAFRSVLPFMLGGVLFNRAQPSPLFSSEGESKIPVYVLTKEEREAAHAQI